jgi:threonine synthase
MNGHASYLQYLQCSECGERYPSDFSGSKRCDDGGVLLARYDLDAASREISRDKFAEGPGTLWRYAPLLPLADPSLALSLGEGWTPLLSYAKKSVVRSSTSKMKDETQADRSKIAGQAWR